MQFTLSIADQKTARAVLDAFYGAGGEDATSDLDEQPKKKRGRPSKADLAARAGAETDVDEEVAEDAEEETDENDAEETDEDGAEETDASDDEETDEEEPAPRKGASGGKLKFGDVVKAWQAYAKKHDRTAAAKLLKKLKVKTIRELKPEQYPGFVKMLKV